MHSCHRALRVLLGLQPLSVNSTRNLLRSGLPAFGTTTAVTILPSLRLDASRLHSDSSRVLPATLRQADRTTSHLTKPANNAGKVIGYQGERDIFVAGIARSYSCFSFT